MSTLGANLAELESLGQLMGTTSTTCNDTATQLSSATTTAIGQFVDQITDLQSRIDEVCTQLVSQVDTAVTTSQTINWTGANHDVFVGAAEDFKASITTTNTNTAAFYLDVRGSIDTLSAAMNEFIAEFTTSMTSAATSTESMQTAAIAQRTALDETMNQGLTIG